MPSYPFPTDDELLVRLRNHEDNFVERKEAFHRDDVKTAVVAFANTVVEPRTGVLFLGVTDDGHPSGKLGGFDATARTKVRLAIEECYPPVRYKLVSLPVPTESGDTAAVAAIVVPESEEGPHFAGGAWVRIGPTSQHAEPEQFQRLVEDRLAPVRFLRHFVGQKITYYSEQSSAGGRAWSKVTNGTLVAINSFFLTIHIEPSIPNVSYAMNRIDIEWDHRKDRDCPMLRIRLH